MIDSLIVALLGTDRVDLRPQTAGESLLEETGEG